MNMNKKKIVFLLSHAPIPRFVKKVKLLKSKHNVILIYWNRSGKKNTSIYGPIRLNDDIQVFPFNKKVLHSKILRAFFYLFFSLKSIITIYKCKPNIIHVANLDMLLIAYIYSKIICDIDIIYEIGDLPSFLFADNEGFMKIFRILYIKLEKQLTKYITKIILTSPYFWKKYYSEFIDESKYFFLANASLENIFKDYEPKDKHNYTIGYIGSIRYWNQIKLLIDAIDNFDPTIKLFFAGDGPSLNKLINYIKNKPNCIYYGSYNYESEASKLYSKINCIYSVYDNKLQNVQIALPNRLYDAILTRLPIISADNTQLGNFISKFEIGFQVDINNPNRLIDIIEELRDNPLLTKKIEENCAVLIHDIDYRILTEKVLSIYE